MFDVDTLLRRMLSAMGFEPQSFIDGITKFQVTVFENIDGFRARLDASDKRLEEISADLKRIADALQERPIDEAGLSIAIANRVVEVLADPRMREIRPAGEGLTVATDFDAGNGAVSTAAYSMPLVPEDGLSPLALLDIHGEGSGNRMVPLQKVSENA